MIELILTLISLVLSPPLEAGPDQTGYVTQFGGEDDKYATEPALCLGRKTRHDDWGIATREGRCGDLYILRNPKNGKWVLVPRIDSGPWLAVKMSCRKGKACRLKKNGSRVMVGAPGGEYGYGGNTADATRRVLRYLGIRGMGRVQKWYVGRIRRGKRVRR